MTAKLRLIGLAGQKGVGKDTVGAFLRDEYGFTVASFAEPLKRGVSGIIGCDRWDDREWKETKLEGLGASPRELLQRIGTEGVRAHFPDFWVDLMRRRLSYFQRLTEWPMRVVITDVRFHNEAQMVRDMGGIVVQVTRPDLNPTDPHASEVTLAPGLIDETLKNDMTLGDIGWKTRGIIWGRMPDVFPPDYKPAP